MIDVDRVDTSPPQSVAAEVAALGSILWASQRSTEDAAVVAKEVFALAPPEAFWRPAHEMIARRIRMMLAAGDTVDPQRVMAALSGHGELTKVGGAPYLHTLMEHSWGNPGAYAAEIRDMWLRRLLIEHAVRAVQLARSPEVEYVMAVTEMAQAVDDAESAHRVTAPIPPTAVGDLINLPITEPSWLAPGLIAVRERVIVTGVEGGGKSELLAQVGACLALGLDPFRAVALPGPVRVLHVDTENEKEDQALRYRRIIQTAERHLGSPWDRGNLWFEDRTEGLELTGTQDVGWLDRLMEACQPQLLILGPLDKLTREDLDKRQAAKALTSTLDALRVHHGCAMLIEAHAGHTTNEAGQRHSRPRGSSYFLGWPNVGLGMRPHVTATRAYPPELVVLERWRGMRSAREWPVALRPGRAGGMPWLPVSADDPALTAEPTRARGRGRS